MEQCISSSNDLDRLEEFESTKPALSKIAEEKFWSLEGSKQIQEATERKQMKL